MMIQEVDHLLDILCPMHLRLTATGHIAHVGPTVAKLRPEEGLIGLRLLEVVEVQRPFAARSFEDLRKLAGLKLHMQTRAAPRTGLKGVLMPLGEGAVINLSFGISVLDAVSDYALTSADFAATDLTIEMLYLLEAKSAAMEASRSLNVRLQGAKIAAEEQAFTDTLTGLKNRRALDHVLARLIDNGKNYTLMHLDLDLFKAVNDTMGHAAGDHVLQHVARIMVEETREEDTVARVGGDEFVLILHRLTDVARLAEIARRIIARMEEPIPFNGKECRVSASIGTVVSSEAGLRDAAAVLHAADLALYASKHAGRGRNTFYDSALDRAGGLRDAG